MKVYRVLGREGRITIPLAMRQAVGFQAEDVVSFELTASNAILVRREAIQGREKPARPISKQPELMVFLESLSRQEQYNALVYLSVLWAEHQRKPTEEVMK